MKHFSMQLSSSGLFKYACSLHYWQSARGQFTLFGEDVLEVKTKLLVTFIIRLAYIRPCRLLLMAYGKWVLRKCRRNVINVILREASSPVARNQ